MKRLSLQILGQFPITCGSTSRANQNNLVDTLGKGGRCSGSMKKIVLFAVLAVPLLANGQYRELDNSQDGDIFNVTFTVLELTSKGCRAQLFSWNADIFIHDSTHRFLSERYYSAVLRRKGTFTNETTLGGNRRIPAFEIVPQPELEEQWRKQVRADLLLRQASNNVYPFQIAVASNYLHGSGGFPMDTNLAAYWSNRARMQLQ